MPRKPQAPLNYDPALVRKAELSNVMLRSLKKQGESGIYIKETADLCSSLDARYYYLAHAISWIRDRIASGIEYEQVPVDFRTFVECPFLMNKKGVLWPKVLEAAAEINSGKYTECVLTGAIGVAKSTIALYTQAYQIYTLACMKDAHAFLGLDPSSEIAIIFQSINKDVAKDVDYSRFRAMIEGSPFFQSKFPFDPSIESVLYFPRRIVVKPVAGHDAAAIGANVIGGVLDEVNFMAVVEKSKQATDGGVYNQAVQNYNAIARRRESRFMKKGWLPGMLCLVSSRKYPGQFTDVKEAEAKTNPNIYIYDKRIWELNPDRFTGETFNVFTGDLTRKPFVVPDGFTVPAQDQHMVMKIPIEYRKSFENDLLAALRDIAGVSTFAIHPYMLDRESIVSSFGKVNSVLSRNETDFETSKLEIYPKMFENKEEPRFVHLDLARSSDSAGVAVGYVSGFKKIERGVANDGKTPHSETLPIVNFDLLLEVKPPKNGEIKYEKIRQLLYALRQAGLNLKWATADTYQSTDTLQILAQNGFITGEQSMDVNNKAYDVTKQAFYDGRVNLPLCEKALSELVRLEVDTKTGKVDHPPKGSKDLADAIAGVVYGLSRMREVWIRHSIPLVNIPSSLSADSHSKRAIEANGQQKI